MQLKTLTLRNFRNYISLDIEFSYPINILVGENASGKSNILESIYMLGNAKSYRTYLDEELINHEKSQFYLKGTLETPLGQLIVEIANSVDGKKLVKIDGKNQQKISDMMGLVRVVIFSPESIEIIKGIPSIRRKFLDQLICQINPAYLHNLQTYQSVIKQRNELLKKLREKKAKIELVEPWNIQIAEAGINIMLEREKVINNIAELSKSKHFQLTQNSEELDISYNPSIDLKNVSNVEDYLRMLKSVQEREIRLGTTTIGPHRDDINILVNGFDARKFCSQGQQRTIALSIKLAEMECIYNELDDQPILLLDDVSSELDQRRAKLVYELIHCLGIQTFITTTGLDGLKDCFLDDQMNSNNELYLNESNDLNVESLKSKQKRWSKDYYEFVVKNGMVKKADI